jgi:hypothetical protein
MNFSTQNNASIHYGASATGEETLRLIAGLPAPKLLEERVKANLNSAARTARILRWPAPLVRSQGWMHSIAARSAAAAAIVFVVAGGSWGVYSRVQPALPTNVILMPLRTVPSNGFSSAGAIRTPQTLNGSVVAHPSAVMPRQNKPASKSANQTTAKSRQSRRAVTDARE